MSMQEQLAQSQQTATLFPLSDYISVSRNVDRGLLANVSIQSVSYSSPPPRDAYEATFGKAFAPARLAVLKRQKFTAEGKRARIDASLAALNAAELIDLPVGTWKTILEEIEDDD